jgi:hypothetical protein
MLLGDTIRWVKKNLCIGSLERGAKLLIRRLEGAFEELQNLLAEANLTR